MNEERPISTWKWWALLIFAAGSVFTLILPILATGSLEDDLIVVTDEHGGYGITRRSLSGPLGPLLVFWVLACTWIGVWILAGQQWKPLAQETRKRLGLAYLAIAWMGGFGWSRYMPSIQVVVILLGALLAIAIAGTVLESWRHRHENGEIFP